MMAPPNAARAPRAFATFLVLLLTVALSGRGQQSASADDSYGEVGTRPAYSARLVGSETEVSLEDHGGRAVMLNVWATWCVPCRKEMPDLQSISEEYRDAGLDVIGVSVDEAGYDANVQRFASDLGAEFTIWRDPEERFNRQFRVMGVPETVLLDRNMRLLGKIRSRPRLGFAGSFVVGMAFGAGWTPCIGPVLAGILTLAATTNSLSQGMGLLAAYSAGLAIPFLLATVALDRFLSASRRFRAATPWINRISGVLLILLAFLLLTGSMSILAGWLSRFALPEWTL